MKKAYKIVLLIIFLGIGAMLLTGCKLLKKKGEIIKIKIEGVEPENVLTFSDYSKIELIDKEKKETVATYSKKEVEKVLVLNETTFIIFTKEYKACKVYTNCEYKKIK